VRIYEFPADFNVAREDESTGLPSGFSLHANYPNPFNPSTSFSFTLPREAEVTVRVYDVTGRVVKTLISSQMVTPGTHSLSWDATSDSGGRVASGTYFYSLEHQGLRHVRPMVLVK
jgi:hypothetical protein